MVFQWQAPLQGVKGSFLSGECSIGCSFDMSQMLYNFVYLMHLSFSTQFLWRPRPPSLLSPEKEEEIWKNLKKYSKKYEQEDQDAFNQLSEQERKRRTELQEEWDSWVAKWKRMHEEERAYRMDLRDGEASDEEEEYEAKEVEVEEVVSVEEEVIAFDDQE